MYTPFCTVNCFTSMAVHSSKFKVGIVHAQTSGWIIIHRHTVDTITYFFVTQYTGRFIMFSVITNIYNKKTKGPTLMELFTATGKPKKFFLTLEMFDECTTGDTAHIQVLATHVSTC